MKKDDVERLWKIYLEAYGPVSSRERRLLLSECVTEDVVSTNPDEELQGFENLAAHIDQFQQRIPGAYFQLDKLHFHHDQVLAQWTLVKDDATALATGYTYGSLHVSQRLKRLTGFF